MNIQIIKAHLGQYKAVRDNVIDGLKDYITDQENTLEDRWEMYKEYNNIVYHVPTSSSVYSQTNDTNKLTILNRGV